MKARIGSPPETCALPGERSSHRPATGSLPIPPPAPLRTLDRDLCLGQLVLELGELISAMDYLRAVQFRLDFKWRMKAVFEEHALDGLVMSTSPMTAILFEKLKVPLGKGSGALADRIKHVAPFNLTGQPAVSVPCGLADDGMPVGLQFVGKPYRDGEALRMAAAFEAATTWHELRPPI